MTDLQKIARLDYIARLQEANRRPPPSLERVREQLVASIKFQDEMASGYSSNKEKRLRKRKYEIKLQ